MNTRRVLKISGLGALVLFAAFGVSILAFGGKKELNTELPPKVPIIRNEPVPKSSKPLAFNNLTESLTETISKEILEKNQAGPLNEQGDSWINVEDPELFVQKIIEKELAAFDPESLYPKIDLARIKTSKDNSKGAQEAYFSAFYKIFEKNFSGVSINFENPQATDFFSLIGAFKKAESEFYDLPAPEILSGFHQRQIVLLGAQANLFSLIRDFETDPLLAFIATQYGDSLTDQVIVLLNEINAYMELNDLII